MKRLFLLVLAVLVLSYLGYSRYLGNLNEEPGPKAKRPILRVALVADSHNENELLARALRQAAGKGINFVVGLGDYTNLGTIDELQAAKKEFDESKLPYFATAGDRDGWQSRALGSKDNFGQVFGQSSHQFTREGIQFVILDNSDIYSGIDSESWKMLNDVLPSNDSQTGQKGENSKFEIRNSKLTFVFAHKTPFHPQSAHVMGEGNEEVARQARNLMNLLEENKIDGFFAGDMHFFAKYNSPGGSVKITTIGAAASERNFQGPRFGILTVWEDYSWEVEDVEIR